MAYATKYSVTFKDVENITWVVKFEEDAFAGAVTTITPGNNPLNITYNQSDKFQPIVGSHADIQMVYQSEVDNLYIETAHTIRVTIERDSTDVWQGWLLPGQYTRHFNQPKHYVTLTASDGLGELKGIKFEDSGDPYYYQQKEITVLSNILQKTGLQLNIYENIDIYEDDMDHAASDSPLDQTYIYADMYWDELSDERSDCYSVLEDIIKKYGAVIKQVGAAWWILRPNAFGLDSIAYRRFTYAGVYSTASTYTSYYSVGSNMRYMYANAEMTKHPGVGRCEIELTNNLRNNFIKNGNFDSHTWDSGTPIYWVKQDAPDIEVSGDSLKINAISGAPTYGSDYLTCTMYLYMVKSMNLSFDLTPYFTETVSPQHADFYMKFKVNTWFLGWGGAAPAWHEDNAYWVLVESIMDYGLSSGEKQHFTVDIPSMREDVGYDYPALTQLEIQIYEYRADNQAAGDYCILDNLILEVQTTQDFLTTKIHAHDNGENTIYNTVRDSVRLGDSWLSDYASVTYDDMMYALTLSTGRGDLTQSWYLNGDKDTVDTNVPLIELLAKQRVEGFWRSMDVLSATFRTTILTSMARMSIMDSHFKDAAGYNKRYYPTEITINAMRSECHGTWIECTPISTDLELDWASETYGTAGITGNEIDMNETVSGTMTATSDAFTVVADENIRVKATVVDAGNSDRPNYSIDGQTGTLSFGTNYLTFAMSTAGSKTFEINHTDGETANCVITFWVYRMSAI